MTQISPGSKKGQQLIMPMVRTEENPNILDGYTLKAIDLRKDWQYLLQTIYDNKIIQQTMEKSYQDFQEGFKLKDFKHRNGIKGAWSFQDINEGIYPYTLTTTDWILEYEEKEWEAQASEDEYAVKSAINEAIEKCKKINGNIDILKELESAKSNLDIKYPPRPSKPESWRPQNASHWSSQWMKILAEIHYHKLSNDWKLIASNAHSIVAGLSENNTAYLIDITLLINNPDKIIKKLTNG
jgi:hypothetical protein